MTSRAALLADATRRLAEAGVESPARDARLLFRWASGLDAPALTARLSDAATADEAMRFERTIRARQARVPLSHITGTRLFWGRSFEVGPAVLDPRPETETLIAAALEGPAPARILDLGTGSGCILATLLAEWPGAAGVGTDISADALRIAERNLAAQGVSGRARLVCADWTAELDGPFDLVVSNPPYIAEGALAGLAPEVRDHEPVLALTAGHDGLDAYRRIAAGLDGLLAPGARALVEVGAGQAKAVAAILMNAGLDNPVIHPDLDGRGRVVCAEKQHKTIEGSING